MATASVARALGSARCCIGLALLLAPRRTLAQWLAADSDAAARTAAQALGARDLAIGLGLLHALDASRTAEARRWLNAGIAGDLTDAAITAFSHGPPVRRASIAAIAVAGAATGMIIGPKLR